ncbi:hypothetical protein RIF29_36126 [Crotalaria pallida]|uniref:Uncharacterized protein n=1 Tax=Crotalaria pallida TaxID=3830 RepID=A0AAN9EBW9_CROPI
METIPLLGFVTKSEGKNERSTIQDDLKERSNKKVKMNDNVVSDTSEMEEILQVRDEADPKSPKISYAAASFMHSVGDNTQGVFVVSDDEELSENKWYSQEDENVNDEEFDPCPEIEVSQVEFEEWCKLKIVNLPKDCYHFKF